MLKLHDMKGMHMKDVRDRLGMTQAQLADALGISTRTVATYEAGTDPPKAIRLACRWLEYEATACAPAPDGDLPDDDDDEHDRVALRLDGIDARITRLHQNAAKAFEQLGHRLQMLELRTGKITPTMSESDIGMIARRAARSVNPE